ncbi:hypothetical protein ACFPVY_05340 [Flavobacterium qiangtangense]|uniref:Uncharacterized protein n=1 Tax=Flavobacterium qiangtangense TaxID=1442595 RepID=A0ABW1PMG9_9FLAO
MMKYFVIILFFFCNCALAQSSDDLVSRNSIKANFSAKAIEAYEENSFAKVNDFYQFLEIYSDKKSSEALKNQVRENLKSLMVENVLVADLFTSEKITLEKLLEQINAKGFKFDVKNIQKRATSTNFWTNSYVLEIKNGTEIHHRNLVQRVYFYPEEKSFGTKKKEVWSIFLGEIE